MALTIRDAKHITGGRGTNSGAGLHDAILSLALHEERLLALDLQRSGLTAAQYQTLRTLANADTGLPMGEVACRCTQSSATMTGIVDRLARTGLAQRERADQDRRVVIVSATALGRRVVDEVDVARRQRAARSLACLSEEEQSALRALIERLLSGEGMEAA